MFDITTSRHFELTRLIRQTSSSSQQLRQLEKAFLQEGGLRERMTQARLTERAKQNKLRP
jgi:four helix bundle suffix protein